MIYNNQRNPILPLTHHVPDSEAHVMPDGKLYIYGSYDLLDDVYCSGEYHVVSTSDMKTWEISDQPSFLAEQVPWFDDPDAVKYPGIDWTHPTPFIQRMLAERADDKANFESMEQGPKPPLLFAPDCIWRNGRYYLYFCMQDDSEGVAVADRPEGPFTDPVQLPCGGIDPAIFIDRDGKAYYYWGQLFSHGVELNGDMISFDRNKIVDDLVTEESNFFHEGSSLRRIGDTYYYVYADMERGKPTSLGYSTGDSPLGPFTYRGIIIDNDPCDPASWNNHGSIECFQGQWYVFYHRCSRGKQQYRRLCIEKIEVLPDGTIPEVKMTSQGVGDPFAPGEVIMGYQACEVHGGCYIDLEIPDEQVIPDDIKTFINEMPSEVLTHLLPGSKAVFRYVKSQHSWTKIKITASGYGKIRIWFNPKQDSDKGILKEMICAGEIDIGMQLKESNHVSGWNIYENTIHAAAGEYELILEIMEGQNLKIAECILDDEPDRINQNR